MPGPAPSANDVIDRQHVSLPWYESLNPVVRGGHEVALLESGREFFPALEDAIGTAVDCIYLETYIFNDDPSGRRVAEALAAAARRGVAVHLIVDGFGTAPGDGQWQQTLRAAGVRLQTFRPDRRRFALDRQRLRRLHRKLAVIDGRVAFVGGINVLDDWYDPNHGRLDDPRLDYAVRVRGPLVAQAHVAAARLWWEVATVNRSLRRGADGTATGWPTWLQLPDPVASEVTSAGRVRAALMLRDNLRHRRTIERAYLRAMGRARREVLLASAYFLPGVRFRRALLAAVRRGVRVRLLLQGKVEYRLPHYGTQALYDELLRGGVEIIEYRRSFLHAKVAVIDDWATVGSSNIDPFSLLLAREANVGVHDAAFARALRARLDAAIEAGGVPIRLQSHQRRPWPVRMMNALAFLVLRVGVALSGAGSRY